MVGSPGGGQHASCGHHRGLHAWQGTEGRVAWCGHPGRQHAWWGTQGGLGSVHPRGHPGGLHASGRGRGRAGGAACVAGAPGGRCSPGDPTAPVPLPAEPGPTGPPLRAASVRERAQRFTPAGPGPAPSTAAAAAGGPAGAGGAGGRAGPVQWQRGPRTAPPGPAQNARGGGGAQQRPAPVPAGARPGLDGMKTCFTIEIKDGRVQPLAPRVVAAPGSQRAGGQRAGKAGSAGRGTRRGRGWREEDGWRRQVASVGSLRGAGGHRGDDGHEWASLGEVGLGRVGRWWAPWGQLAPAGRQGRQAPAGP